MGDFLGIETPSTVRQPEQVEPPMASSPASSNSIRNIAQTVQEREIVKTCPDVVVYIEGKPYITNPFINLNDSRNQSNSQSTSVPFNDYIDSFSVSYQVDNLVPTASFSLNIPASRKYLFQAPGGNNILEPMMQVQVFAKGYFFAQNGNTLYYRVFKGLITSVSYTDTGTALQVAVSCKGTMHFLDLMYVDLQTSQITNSPTPVTPFNSNQYLMSPYQMLADIFTRSVTFEGFQLTSIQQDSLKAGTSDWKDSVKAQFISRWQTILTNVTRDVRILGYGYQDITGLQDSQAQVGVLYDTFTAEPKDAVGQMAYNMRASTNSRVPQKSIIAQASDKDLYINIMRTYLPDFQVAAVQQLGGKTVPRSERIRFIANLIGYEGYQDLDGAIVFKPPYYNLDVTNLGTDPAAQGQGGSFTSSATSAASYIRANANPFVVYLSEIETETEVEDEANVRATRMCVQPDFMSNLHFPSAEGPQVLPVADHIDIAKLAKFGLREQPLRNLNYLGQNDLIALYTYAVSELNRANRGYRTYTFSIPLRPEIRLGFPMYIPHRDMYGYINSVSISYQQGQSATMQVTLDTIRRRPLLPTYTTVTDAGGNQRQVTTYVSQKDLVLEWTVPPSPSDASSSPAQTAPSSSGSGGSAPAGSGSTGGGSPSTSPLVNLPGTPATLTQPPDAPFHPQEWEYLMYKKEKIGNLYATRFDTKGKSFRFQNDVVTAADLNMAADDGSTFPNSPPLSLGKPFFSGDTWGTGSGIDMRYYKKIQTCQPYTDDKGYEVVSPFPWGRWIDVNTAIRHSRQGILSQSANLQGAGQVQNLNVFLFAGIASPGQGDISSTLSKSLSSDLSLSSNGQASASGSGYDSVELDSVIELETPQANSVGNDDLLTQLAQPDMQSKSPQSGINDIANRLGVFVTGGVSLPNVQTVQGTASKVTPNPAPQSPQGTGAPFSIPLLTEGTPLAG
jgi:hypothetical protein